MVDSKLKTIVFDGILEHKNPKCSKCQGYCFALYQGGRKERIEEFFSCKKCNILYTMPSEKRCEFKEDNFQ